MEQFVIYVSLLAIVVFVGAISRKLVTPLPLLLVIAGMILSFIPSFPHISLRPDIVLNIFLPLLLYETSSESSWRDFKINFRPIALLSVGHVIFITVLVAVTMHALIPELGWPLAFVLGAVISPPDDVAIIPIAEATHMPRRIQTILKGEAMFNDATALILFRLALAAAVTQQFLIIDAIGTFCMIVVGETIYGIILGNLVGIVRVKFRDSILQMMVSILTPFIAYIPAEKLGGTGVLATVVTGLVIGHQYLDRLTPESRLVGNCVWRTLGFAVQSILFLLVGLDLFYIVERISSISVESLAIYSIAIVLVVIIGRFIWVYPATYLPRVLFTSIRKADPYPPWQIPFVTSWSGLRGGISLAAALAIPVLPHTVEGANPKDLIVFLVFIVIAATLLLQGLTLPWLLDILGLKTYGKTEEKEDHVNEWRARVSMAEAVLNWLDLYHKEMKEEDRQMEEEVRARMQEYQNLKKRLLECIDDHQAHGVFNEQSEFISALALLSEIIEVERAELNNLWQEQKISHEVRMKLQQQLDHRARYATD